MPETSLSFPFGGRSDADAYSDQAPLTTRSCQNVRARNPKNGRMQGAQRAGLSKVNAMTLGSGRIKELCSIVGDNRKTTYAELASGSEVETAFPVLPGKGICRDLKTDRFGNVYALDGNAGLVKFNSTGTKVWELAIPVTDPNHIIRALWVEPDLLNFYVGVSEGGDQTKAKVWAYRQISDNRTEVIWELELGRYTEQVKVVGDQLFMAVNDVRARLSTIEVYGALEAASGPVLAWRQRDNVAYPVNGMDVSPSGAVFLAFGEAEEADPITGYRAGNFSQGEYWGPSAVNEDVRGAAETAAGHTPGTLWAHYRAEEIEAADVDGAVLEDGAEVILWRDISGNGRHLTVPAGDVGPIYTARGVGGRPTLTFDGVEAALISGANPDTSRRSTDRQKSVLPGYDESIFHVWVVFRPSFEARIGCVLSQQNDEPSSSAEISLWANRAERDGVTSATPTEGAVSLFDDTTFATGTQATGTNDHPAAVTFTGSSGILVNFTINNDIASTNSSFRVNGSTISPTIGIGEVYDSAPWSSAKPTYIGRHHTQTDVYYKGEISEIVVVRGVAASSTSTADTMTLTNTVGGGGAVTVIEGIEAWRYGTRLGSTATIPHAFQSTIPAPPGGSSVPHETVLSQLPVVAKYANNSGKLLWAVNSTSAGIGLNEEGGFGWGVVVGEGLDVFSSGPSGDVTGFTSGFPIARKIIDEGEAFSLDSADGAWLYELASEASPDYAYPRMAVDEFGNLYLPLYETDETHEAAVKVLERTGVAGVAVEKNSVALSSSQHAHAVAIHPEIPDYSPDAVEVAECIFVGTENGGDQTVPTVSKVGLISTTTSSGAPRTRANLGVINNGSIRRFYLDGVTAHTDPTNGTSALSSSSDYIQCSSAFIKVGNKRKGISECAVFVDGTQAPKVYTLRDDAITPLEAKTAGEVPPRPRLVEFWRQRLVLLPADNPHLLSMSAIGDIEDWDFAPPEPLATSAVRLSLQRAGSFSDVVNGFAPINDDVALVGGDKSLWLLRGDPRDGGQFDRITSSIGLAFGRAYVLAPDGSLYFWGIPSGLYRYVPGGGIERISIQTLDDTDFRNLADLSTHYIRLFYSDEFKCIWIYQFPYGSASEVQHWCVELKTHKAVQRPPVWPDTYSLITTTPTSGLVVDGDNPNDRMMILGCVDGFLRKYDSDSASDDGTAIDSFFVTPWLSESVERELMLTELTVEFSTALEGMRYELFASQEAEILGAAKKSGILGAGRNQTVRDRVGGAYLAVRLRNAQLGETWALERMTANIEGKGRRRASRGR